MRIAVQGCCHGDLDKIYDKILQHEDKYKIEVELLLICGDFQAIRDEEDLRYLSCPPKYRRIGDFKEYFEGKKKAPVLTLFIGGNHEAVNCSRELYFGGYVAENIYFMGYSGCVQIVSKDGTRLRIAGCSGIYTRHDYKKGYYEQPPFASGMQLKTAYRTRYPELEKLRVLTDLCSEAKERVDIMISHDWPEGIYNFGDFAPILRIKDKNGQMANDIAKKQLGNPHYMDLLRHMQPDLWFAAHMHVKFPADVKHESGEATHFLALDKCLPRGGHLEFFDLKKKEKLEYSYASVKGEEEIKERNIPELIFDKRWLAVLSKNYANLKFSEAPSEFQAVVPTKEEIQKFESLEVEISEHLKFQQTLKNYQDQRHAMLKILEQKEDYFFVDENFLGKSDRFEKHKKRKVDELFVFDNVGEYNF